MALIDSTLEVFAQRLASADPTPGGGSASAYVGALAAALVRMVANLTVASSKPDDRAADAERVGMEAERLQRELVRCVDDDASAFDGVTAAYRLPKTTEGEKAARSAAIQQALIAATQPPMRVVDTAREACGLAGRLADFGNPAAISDVGCAVLCAKAAAQGAAFNVFINVRSLKDRSLAEDYRRRVRAALAHVDVLAEVVLGKVQAQLES